MSAPQRLSVPAVRKSIPRPLSAQEEATLIALADLLCGPNDRCAPPSQHQEYSTWLHTALASRSDSFDTLMDLAARAAAIQDHNQWLRDLSDAEPEAFQVLSTVLGGAYLMLPAVKEAIGYPGQRRDIPGLSEAVDEIMDGILDPVLERGHFFVPTPKV